MNIIFIYSLSNNRNNRSYPEILAQLAKCRNC